MIFNNAYFIDDRNYIVVIIIRVLNIVMYVIYKFRDNEELSRLDYMSIDYIFCRYDMILINLGLCFFVEL